jgi:hypothetical protein
MKAAVSPDLDSHSPRTAIRRDGAPNTSLERTPRGGPNMADMDIELATPLSLGPTRPGEAVAAGPPTSIHAPCCSGLLAQVSVWDRGICGWPLAPLGSGSATGIGH